MRKYTIMKKRRTKKLPGSIVEDSSVDMGGLV
jgi:hypothetical protein